MKRKNKTNPDALPKIVLRARIRDIAIGAGGFNFDMPDEFATAEILSRWIPALEIIFGTPENAYLWRPHNLDRYENIDTATHFIWSGGVRP